MPTHKTLTLLASLVASTSLWAAPTVSRLTPPSELFSHGQAAPVIARFAPGQRFDLQATIRPDSGQGIASASFEIDGTRVNLPAALRSCASGCVASVPTSATIATVRAVSVQQPGLHRFSVHAVQSDGQTVRAEGNFEVLPLVPGMAKAKNIIILLGDGMGVAHRTAARIMQGGYTQGKVSQPLAMDSFPVTGLVKTASLNSMVTDSSPGMTSYVLGNKNNNNEEGVFPDDTVDPFDNPRIEYLSEYLHRTQGKALGIVTTADVFDATPAGNAVHTSNRGAGTGIVDQFFDDRERTGLRVLMGGGRKWFLPATTPGSARSDRNDYAFSATDAHTADIAQRWGAAPGAIDSGRDLIGQFEKAGYRYAATKTDLDAVDTNKTDRLLGLFAFGNMNVALDKIDGRRARAAGQTSGSVVDDYGLPDQPLLDEMARKALAVLSRNPAGFVLMIEGASIDKQSHALDTERWLLEVLEFDHAVAAAKAFAESRGDTLVIITADHETAGASVIGASKVSDAQLQALAAAGGGKDKLRDQVVGVYEEAGFPHYNFAPDGFPVTTNIDRRLLLGYGANPDRYEDWRTNPQPLQDGGAAPGHAAPASYPAGMAQRDTAGQFLITGHIPGKSAVHTGTDVPLSAFGPGAWAFTGVQDNTDVFFKLVQAATLGTPAPAWWPAKAPAAPKRARHQPAAEQRATEATH